MPRNWEYRLRAGHSDDPAEGACAMDAVNWLVHGRHGDLPECACPVISGFVTGINDAMDDITRQSLIPYLHRIAGSRSREHEAERIKVLVLAAIKQFIPAALDCLGQPTLAQIVRVTPRDISKPTLDRVLDKADEAFMDYRNAISVDGYEHIDRITATRMILSVRRIRMAANTINWSSPLLRAVNSDLSLSIAGHNAASAMTNLIGILPTVRIGWLDVFETLDRVLAAGPQGEPWSADVIEAGMAAYRDAGGPISFAGVLAYGAHQ